jgi:hypothetical protein
MSSNGTVLRPAGRSGAVVDDSQLTGVFYHVAGLTIKKHRPPEIRAAPQALGAFGLAKGNFCDISMPGSPSRAAGIVLAFSTLSFGALVLRL